MRVTQELSDSAGAQGPRMYCGVMFVWLAQRLLEQVRVLRLAAYNNRLTMLLNHLRVWISYNNGGLLPEHSVKAGKNKTE